MRTCIALRKSRKTAALNRTTSSLRQLLHKRRVLRTLNPFLCNSAYSGEIAAYERVGVKPKPRKRLTAVAALRVARQPLVAIATKDKPIHRAIRDAPDDVFDDSTPKIHRQLDGE